MRLLIFLTFLISNVCYAASSEWLINYCRDFSEVYGKKADNYSTYFRVGRDEYRVNSAKKNVDESLKEAEDSFYQDRKTNPLFKVPGNTVRFETMHLIEKTMILNAFKYAYENPSWEYTDFRERLYQDCVR